MDTVISRYSQAVRSRRARTRQDRIARAHRAAIRPASEDPYLLAFGVTPFR
jgi:hypothetical protein